MTEENLALKGSVGFSRETMKVLLEDLERAAWTRKWSALKKARAAILDHYGVVLRGTFEEKLK